MAKRLIGGIALACGLLAQGITFAAPLQVQAPVSAPEPRQPNWGELTAEQKRILTPVFGEWDNMPAHQRKKLLGVAKGYPKKTPAEQQRIQKRLKAWSKLSPSEREHARKRYEKLKQLPPEKRQEVQKKWQEYQQLPEEKKEELRRSKVKPAEIQPTVMPEPPKTSPTLPVVESATPIAPPKAEAWPNPWQFDTPRP